MQETQVQSLGQEDLLEKEMATHSSILAWQIPWTEEPGGLQVQGVAKRLHFLSLNRLVEKKKIQGLGKRRKTQKNLHINVNYFLKIYQHMKVNYVGFKNEYQLPLPAPEH